MEVALRYSITTHCTAVMYAQPTIAGVSRYIGVCWPASERHTYTATHAAAGGRSRSTPPSEAIESALAEPPTSGP